MFGAEEIIRRLKPLLGQQADTIWNSFLASDDEERKLIQHSLEMMHSQAVDDYKKEKIILTPPSEFGQLYGDYPVGMVWYAGKPLYPFALMERELVQHIGVFGRTGAGKSYLVRGLLLTHLFLNKPVLVFDWKGTYTDFASHPAGVLLFIPGSASLPFCFNPLDLEGIPSEQQKAYLRQVIDIFIDSYLEDLKLLTVQGVEYLLLLAVDNLIAKKGKVTFSDIYEWLTRFEGRMREMDWKTSALTILYKLITGPLGNVMQKSWSMEWLVKQKALFELNNAGSAKDKSFLIRTLLLRLYYHFLEQGTSDSMKLFIVIEEAHNILLRKGSGYETIIELVLRQIREFGVGICVVDQHPSLMSLPALGTYCTVAFNLRLKQDRDAMASALNLEEKEYLGRLPSRFAIVKIQDRFLEPFLIKTFSIHKPRKQEKLPTPLLLSASDGAHGERDERQGQEKKPIPLPVYPLHRPTPGYQDRKPGKKASGTPRSSAHKKRKPKKAEVLPEYLQSIVDETENAAPKVRIPPEGIAIDSEECYQIYRLLRMAGSEGFSGKSRRLETSGSQSGQKRSPGKLDYSAEEDKKRGSGEVSESPDGKRVPMVSQEGLSDVSQEVSQASQEVSQVSPETMRIREFVAKQRKEPLSDPELLMCHLYAFPLKSTGQRYADLGWNWEYGNRQRHSLQDQGLVRQEKVSTQKGRIKLIVPTMEGYRWLEERKFYSGKPAKRVSIEHRYWQRRLRDQFQKLDYCTEIESPLKRNSAVDLVVSKGKRKVAVEIETGKNSYREMAENIRKCRGKFCGIVSFVLNNARADEMRKRSKEGMIVSEESSCILAVRRLLGDTD